MFKQRRLDLGLRLKDLAQQLQTTPQCLSRYESGKRRWPPQLLQRLQDMLGLGQGLCTDWLLSWEQHLDRAGWNRWQVGVDPGPTWANTEPAYDDFYRQLRPRGVAGLTSSLMVPVIRRQNGTQNATLSWKSKSCDSPKIGSVKSASKVNENLASTSRHWYWN